jgi:hypothetical protein
MKTKKHRAAKIYWPHIWWLIQAVQRVIDCNERCIYSVLIIQRIIWGVFWAVFQKHLLAVRVQYKHAPAFFIFYFISLKKLNNV